MSLRFAILGFLSIRPMSGYDLKRTFDTSVRHFWTADQAAIYRGLAELEADGHVTHERVAQEIRPDRKVFAITAAGLESLDAWLAIPTPAPPRREPLLVKLFFSERLTPDAMRALLEREVADLESELAAISGYADAMQSRAASMDTATMARLTGPLITLSNGVMLGVAYHEWLRGLLRRQAEGTLTAAALLTDAQHNLSALR